MDASTVLSAISTVGFPIVMCLLMWYSNKTTLEKVNEMATCITNNTTAINELKDKLDSLADKKGE